MCVFVCVSRTRRSPMFPDVCMFIQCAHSKAVLTGLVKPTPYPTSLAKDSSKKSAMLVPIPPSMQGAHMLMAQWKGMASGAAGPSSGMAPEMMMGAVAPSPI